MSPMEKEFVCQCCGACCRIADGICRVNAEEIARIAAFLGMSEADFIASETDLAPDRKSLMLRNTPDGACVWLDDQSRCRIHPVKPDKCRTFPMKWTNANSAGVCPALKQEQRRKITSSTIRSPSSAKGD